MFSAFGITDYFAYLLGTVAIIVLPGPNSMYCLYVASSQGISQGYKTLIAIVLGDSLLMLAAFLGAASLLKAHATIFVIFKMLGGFYLAYVGLSLIMSSVKNFNNSSQSIKSRCLNSLEIASLDNKKISKAESVFIKALTLSVSNPKAILFFLSFFLQFISPSFHNPAISFAILGITLQMISIAYLSVLIFSGAKLANFFRKHHTLGIIGNSLVGMLFMSFAITLWKSEP